MLRNKTAACLWSVHACFDGHETGDEAGCGPTDSDGSDVALLLRAIHQDGAGGEPALHLPLHHPAAGSRAQQLGNLVAARPRGRLHAAHSVAISDNWRSKCKMLGKVSFIIHVFLVEFSTNIGPVINENFPTYTKTTKIQPGL